MSKKLSPPNERLESVLQYLGLTYYGLAKEIGKTTENLYNIRDGKIKSISLQIASLITKKYNQINIDWLMDGIGEMLLSEKKETENYENKIQNDILQKGIKKITGKQAKFEARSVPHEDFMEAKLVPIKGYAGLSKAGFADLEYLDTLDSMLVPREYEKGVYMVIEVSGDSMNDGTQRALLDGDKYLAKQLPKSNLKYKLLYKQYLFLLVLKVRGIQFVEIIDHNTETGIITCHKWNPMEGPDFTVNLFEDVIDIFYLKKLVERKITF